MVFFHKQRRHLSTAMVILLIGGWLSVACQNCFAHAEQNNLTVEIPQNDHCANQSDSLPDGINHSDSEENCFDDCACSSLVSRADTTTSTLLTQFFEFEFVFLQKPINTNYIVDRRNPCPTNIPPLNHSRLTPIDTYCIQLK